MTIGVLDVQGIRFRLDVGFAAEWVRCVYPFWFRPDDGGSVNGSLQHSGGEDAHGLVEFQHRLDDAVLAQLTRFVPAHAGVVEFNGRLLVFPAPSRSGKSSLVAHLVDRGARYFSDEYALIDQNGRVHAYPRPPMLRDPSGRSYLDLSVVAQMTQCPKPRRADVVLFLEHRPGAPSATLERLDAAAATIGLLKNTPHTWAHRPELVTTLARATASAVAYRGVRGDARAAWDAIEARLAKDTQERPRYRDQEVAPAPHHR